MKRYVIGFGFEFDRYGKAINICAEEPHKMLDTVALIVELAAAIANVPAYSLRFGSGSWVNDAGNRVTEQGATAEYIAEDSEPEKIRALDFAREIKHALDQEAVLFYAQPVEQFQFI